LRQKGGGEIKGENVKQKGRGKIKGKQKLGGKNMSK
jgi:hypothetical protein